MKGTFTFRIVLVAVAAIVILSSEVQGIPQPQNRPGLISAFNQLFTGAGNIAQETANAVANGASTGFQAFGNGAQEILNGALNTYNSAAGGIVNGFQTFLGNNTANSTTAG